MKKKKTSEHNSNKNNKEKNKNLINRKIKRNSNLNNNKKNVEKNIRNKNENKDMKNQIIPELKLFEDLIDNINVTAYYQGKFIYIFTSKENILYLLYSKNNSIICYNLIDKKVMTVIKNAHPDYIRTFSHCFDEKEGIDLLISISEHSLKVWNFNNLENILSIEVSKRAKKKFYMGCFINENSNINILIINKDYSKNDGNFKYFNTFNILNLYGTNIESIKQDDAIMYIDCYYNKKNSENYIILGYSNEIHSYDYKNKKIYNEYYKSYINDCFFLEYINIIINDNDELIKIIASNYKFIEIWNFDTGILINKINVYEKIYSMGLWNDKFLFVGSNGNIKLIDYEEGEIMENKIIKVQNILPRVTYIEKYEIPLYGECLFSACGCLLKIFK